MWNELCVFWILWGTVRPNQSPTGKNHWNRPGLNPWPFTSRGSTRNPTPPDPANSHTDIRSEEASYRNINEAICDTKEEVEGNFQKKGNSWKTVLQECYEYDMSISCFTWNTNTELCWIEKNLLKRFLNSLVIKNLLRNYQPLVSTNGMIEWDKAN